MLAVQRTDRTDIEYLSSIADTNVVYQKKAASVSKSKPMHRSQFSACKASLNRFGSCTHNITAIKKPAPINTVMIAEMKI
jgi:hypothetical protein